MLTRPDARSGRGRRLSASPVRRRAEEAGVPVLTPPSLRSAAAVAALAAFRPDCCPVVAYGQLVPAAALRLPRRGWVNLHFSLLPAWRGAAPVQWALLAGDDITGASTFLLDEGLDTGPVLGTLTETVGARDTTGELLGRLATGGARLLVATLDAIAAGSAEARPQPADGVSHAPKLTVAQLRLDWAAPAVAVDRLIRAAWPAPGAWTTFRGERLKVAPLATAVAMGNDAAAAPTALAPGEVAADRTGGAVWVGTGSWPVPLGQLRPAGRALMPAAAWWRGVRAAPGERLE